MKNVAKVFYESMMILLVIATIITIWRENTYNSTINWVVWAIFFADFLIRFFLAEKKWDFVKRNPFLIIAIIPFDQFFQLARIVRLIYFFRIKTIAKYYITPYVRKLTYQSITLIIVLFISLLFIEALIVWNLEKTIATFVNGLSVVFGHLLFFGHRIYIVNHTVSIWLLTITSILGVVLQGLALQWLFSKIDEYYKKLKQRVDSSSVS